MFLEGSNLKYQWTVLTVTTAGILMSGINSSIIIIGLPALAAALNANIMEAIWFTQAYLLGSTVVVPIIGRLTDMFGRVRIYLIGFVIFTAGALLTSLSLNSTEVIIFRSIQGFGSGIIGVNSAVIVTDATPPNKLGLALGINQTAFRAGSILGLTLSGVVLSFLDWRALFYINVPIGIFGIIWAKLKLKEITKKEVGTSVDWFGFVTFTASITSFLLALTFTAYGMSEMTQVYILLAIGAANMAAFVAYERSAKHPMLDFSILRIREFTGGVIAQLLNILAFGAVTLLLSLYLQLGLGLSPFDAGIRIVPYNLSFVLVGVISGNLSDRFGPRPFTTGGVVLTSLSLLLLSQITTSTPYTTLALYIVIFGVSVGLFSSPNMSSIMGAVPPHRRGVAAAFRTLMMNLGMVLSLNVAVLFMTFTIPFSELSQVISGSTRNLSSVGFSSSLFIEAIKNTFLGLAILDAIAIIPSALRGKRSNQPV